jgi:hypothetical protein
LIIANQWILFTVCLDNARDRTLKELSHTGTGLFYTKALLTVVIGGNFQFVLRDGPSLNRASKIMFDKEKYI